MNFKAMRSVVYPEGITKDFKCFLVILSFISPLALKPANSFFKNKVCNTCTEECVLAARVRTPMGFYYT